MARGPKIWKFGKTWKTDILVYMDCYVVFPELVMGKKLKIRGRIQINEFAQYSLLG